MIDGARFAVFEDLIGTFLVRARSCPASSASRITRLIQTSFSVFAFERPDGTLKRLEGPKDRALIIC